ncbi:MAG TPA: RNA polymerase factor sigma-54 [Thermomicrobiales bacterium]|nr:RNA polymerase factor sigma-54 [Thermomicrobiales bacterium]
MAWMETGFDIGQEMRPWVSPSLIEANYILSLSQQELQNVIEAEMAANPALELEDRATCPVCESVLEGTFCPTCMSDQTPPRESESLDSFEDYPESAITTIATREEESDFDPMTLVASDISVPDQIIEDARLALHEHEYGIAEFIVESLDERGFLTIPTDEIAKAFGVDAEQVGAVLDVIQDVAPIGVGARDLRECLLLQIDYLERTGQAVPAHAREIIDRYLAEFGAHKFGHIARALGISVEELEDIRDFIRGHLNPFPLQSDQAKSWRSPTDARFVAPDVVIDLRDDELVVEVIDNKFFHLRTNAMYDQLANQFGRRRGKSTLREKLAAKADAEAVVDTSDDDKAHVRQYTNRAKMFMSNIQQRRDTLLRISQCICELQESFLRGGVRELRPLTRALVAQQVGVHESTVSRATANKYVMLPTRKVIPFSDFFTPSLSTKDIIKEIIERESQKGQTLTDRKICDLLLQDGIRIARRTVAKYRAELGILPSTMR